MKVYLHYDGCITLRSYIDVLLSPRSIAVIGASREPHKVGHIILRNILESGFRGRVYPVNPKADKILDLKCYPSILDVPDDVDIAVIAVPAKIAVQVFKQCCEKKVPVVIVISAGFKEIGPEGAKLEQELVKLAREHGVRLLGPNCLGYMNLDVNLNATFAAITPPRGNVALISQSGAVITALLDISRQFGIGFSKVVSLGNKADLDEVDFLKVLLEDENTKYIVMYLESIERGQEFLKAARQVAKRKLVAVLKAGVTERGARAVSSHTGALAGSAEIYNIAFKQCGIVQLNTFRELVMLLRLLSGNFNIENTDKIKTVILTNAGGPGILATDYCEKLGIDMPTPSPDVIAELREKLPREAAVHNPIDVLGDATPDRYETALRVLVRDPNITTIIVLATPQAMTRPLELAERLVKIREECPQKLIIAVLLGGEVMKDAVDLLVKHRVPVFTQIEDAIDALSVVDRYLKLREKILEEEEVMLRSPHGLEDVQSIIEKAKLDGRKVLLLDEALAIMRLVGVNVPEGGTAKTVEEAVTIAEKIGYPVVMRIVSPDIMHKSDIGCVKLNVKSPEEVKMRFYEILENATRYVPHARIYGVHISKMVSKVYELFVGAMRDPHFGPVVMFGMGGVYVELFRDVSMRIVPLSRRDAFEMIFETKIGKMMMGYRGSKTVNISDIVDIILKIASLVYYVEDIVELDVNPLIVAEDGVYAVDVKIVVR